MNDKGKKHEDRYRLKMIPSGAPWEILSLTFPFQINCSASLFTLLIVKKSYSAVTFVLFKGQKFVKYME